MVIRIPVNQCRVTSPAAVDRIPNFLADPNTDPSSPMPHHQATIHLNCEDSSLIQQSYLDCQRGQITQTWVGVRYCIIFPFHEDLIFSEFPTLGYYYFALLYI